MELIGRKVIFQVERPGEPDKTDDRDGVFLAWGLRGATDEGAYSRPNSSYSCAIIEDSFGYVHSVELERVQFKHPLG